MTDEPINVQRGADPDEPRGEVWPDPVPLASADTLPPFPVDALPDPIRDFVEAGAVSLQVAEEMIGSFALGALSAVAGGRVWVEPKDGWHEPVNLYVGTIAAPSERKSPAQSAAIAPVIAHEAAMVEETRGTYEAARSRRELLEADAARAKQDYLRASSFDRDSAAACYEQARAALSAMPEPTVWRLLAGDVTPERAIELLSEQNGRLALLSDEDTLIGHLSGRYSKNPAIEPFLSAYSCAPISVDRRGRPPVRCMKPCLTISTPIQPGLFRDAAGNAAIKGRGLLDRFTLFVPRSFVGHRDIDSPAIPPHVSDAYHATITGIARSLESRPVVLPLDPAARKTWIAWCRKHERAMRPGGKLAPIQSWAGKSEGRCLRIAALLHLAEGRGARVDDPISDLAMTRAVRIMDVLADHRLAAEDLLGADAGLNQAREVSRWLADEGHRSITLRDVQRAFRSFKRADDARRVMRLLAAHHVVRPVRVSGERGRPSETYEVSPRLSEVVLSFLSPVVEARSKDHSLSSSPPVRVSGTADKRDRTPAGEESEVFQ